MQNPVTPIVYQLLDQCPDGFSLLDLIKQCDQLNLFDHLADEHSEMALFYKNFFAMNALFTVQDQLFEEHVGVLHVESIRCYFSPIITGTSQSVAPPMPDMALKAYYQDWSSLDEMDLAGVQALLNGFWNKYLAFDEVEQNCNILKIPSNELSRSVVKRQFRSLASCHHPDKGGDSREFIRLRKAYESLMRVCDN
jgi:hypothetical protein